MNIILLEKVQNLGGLGDQVTVRSGFGRNFLIPQGKAVPATKDNIEHFERRRSELESQAAEKLAQAQSLAAKLGETSFTIASKAGDEGKLFGSIGTRDIANMIIDTGINIEKKQVLLPHGAIRQVGEYNIEIHCHTDVNATIKVTVIPE